MSNISLKGLQIIPSRMLDAIPGDKIPELIEARNGYNSLLEHLVSLRTEVDNLITTTQGLIPYDGQPINLSTGATIPSDANLQVDGTAIFNGSTYFTQPITSIGDVYTTGPFGVNTVVATVHEKLIESTTELFTFCDFTPVISANFLIYIYIRILDTSIISVDLTYRDETGNQTQSLLKQSSQNQGSYTIPPVFINAVANNPIKLSAKCNLANTLYISASIIGL